MTAAYEILHVPAASAERIQNAVLAAEPTVTPILLGQPEPGGDPDGRIATPEQPPAVIARSERIDPVSLSPRAYEEESPSRSLFSLFGSRAKARRKEAVRPVDGGDEAAQLRKKIHELRDRMLTGDRSDPDAVAELNRLIAAAEAAEKARPEGELPDPIRQITGRGAQEVPMAILPTPHAWQACAWLQAGRWIARADVETHLAHHRLWHERHLARPITATVGSLGFDVVNPPREPEQARALAAEHQRLGADILATGAENLDAYARMLIGAPRWWLVWN